MIYSEGQNQRLVNIVHLLPGFLFLGIDFSLVISSEDILCPCRKKNIQPIQTIGPIMAVRRRSTLAYYLGPDAGQPSVNRWPKVGPIDRIFNGKQVVPALSHSSGQYLPNA